MEWLSDFGHWLLVSRGGLVVGTLLIWLGVVTGGGYFLWRYGGVRMGPDPELPPADEPVQVAGGTYQWRTDVPDTEVIPVVPAQVFMPQPFHPPTLSDCFIAAEDFTHDVTAVTEVIEQVIEVTRTTELVITIPEPLSLYPARHRREDVNAETRNLTDAIRRAKELAP